MKLITAALLAASASVMAQPANDECDFAESISGFGNFAYDTTDATNSAFPEDDIPADVWFFWTAEKDSTVSISTCGNAAWDTMLAVYTGDCFEAVEIAYNDDACALQSEVEFTATNGQTYLVRAGGYDGATGAATLTIAEGGLPYTIVYSEYNAVFDKTYTLVQVGDIQGVQVAASDLGGDVVVIESADENEFIRSRILGFDGGDRRAFIGLSDVEVEGDFVWMNGDPSTYRNWAGGEPNDGGGGEDYAEILGSSGEWNDIPSPHVFTSLGVVQTVGGGGCAPDLNGDTALDIFDVIDFLAIFDAGDAAADWNGDTVLDIFDVIDYLAAFDAGC